MFQRSRRQSGRTGRKFTLEVSYASSRASFPAALNAAHKQNKLAFHSRTSEKRSEAKRHVVALRRPQAPPTFGPVRRELDAAAAGRWRQTRDDFTSDRACSGGCHRRGNAPAAQLLRATSHGISRSARRVNSPRLRHQKGVAGVAAA